MDSVRHYRQRIDAPELKKEIQGFIGQEAMHSREHVAYNHLLQAAGLPAHTLAVTIALEHYTAMLAEILLSDPSRFGDSLKGYQQMWYWHALEETEHKAVAFDVWNSVLSTCGPCQAGPETPANATRPDAGCERLLRRQRQSFRDLNAPRYVFSLK